MMNHFLIEQVKPKVKPLAKKRHISIFAEGKRTNARRCQIYKTDISRPMHSEYDSKIILKIFEMIESERNLYYFKQLGKV